MTLLFLSSGLFKDHAPSRTLPEGSWTCVANLIKSFGKSCLFHFIVRSSHLICAGLDSRLVRP
jgi:hypothetical protein